MRDAHLTTGIKMYYQSIAEAHKVVISQYPGAQREGSIGAWSWSVDGYVVAEAWIHPTKLGWWVRIERRDR